MGCFKKYGTMIVSVLLLAATLFLVPFGQSDIKVGKGKGKDLEVETIDELKSVLDFISKADFLNNNDNGGELYSLVASEENAEYEETENKHSSVTFHTESASKISSSYNGPTTVSESYVISTSMESNKNMSVYMTKDASYYRSVGNTRFFQIHYDAKKRERVTETYYIVFDVEFFFDKNGALMKYNEWLATGDAPVVFSGEMLGKWFGFEDPEVAEALCGVDLFNRQTLGQIGNYFNENGDSHFAKNDGVYSLKEDHLPAALGYIFGVGLSDEIRGELTVDLSRPETPSIVFSADYSNKNSAVNNSQATISTYGYDHIRFENIDNTEIYGLAQNVEVEMVTDPEAFAKKYIVEYED